MLCIFVFHQWFLALIFFLRGMLLEYFNYVLPMFFSLIENTEMKEMKYTHKLPKSMNYRIAVSIMLPLIPSRSPLRLLAHTDPMAPWYTGSCSGSWSLLA